LYLICCDHPVCPLHNLAQSKHLNCKFLYFHMHQLWMSYKVNFKLCYLFRRLFLFSCYWLVLYRPYVLCEYVKGAHFSFWLVCSMLLWVFLSSFCYRIILFVHSCAIYVWQLW
jgi:hypothetical protein